MEVKHSNEKLRDVGKVERKPSQRGFHQGLIVDTPHIHHIETRPNGGVVDHPGSWRLAYQPKSQGSGFRFDLYFDGKEVCLNEIVNPKWPIYPVASGSCIFADAYGFVDGSQRWNITKINLGIEDFRASKVAIIDAFHELGHAIIYETILRAIKEKDKSVLMELVQAFFPKARLTEPELPELPSGSFGKEISDALDFFKAWLVQNNLGHLNRRLHERGAWAYALRAAKGLGLLEEIKHAEVHERYHSYLATYGDEVLEKAGAIAGRK